MDVSPAESNLERRDLYMIIIQIVLMISTLLSLLFAIIRFLFDCFGWWPREKGSGKMPRDTSGDSSFTDRSHSKIS